MKKVPLSILIPIRNEAANLRRCLGSVAWADEIFVVDSASTDDSVAIAESLGAQIVQFHYNGTWPKKKNWELQNLPFRRDWVLILDADETLPPAAEGYWINRRFMFMERWLKHAYFPNWNLRLFQHRLGRYKKITGSDTASGDNEVHEHIVVQGRTARLACLMDHYAFPSVEVFVERHNRYSNWEARVATDGDLHSSGLQSAHVGWRRKLKRWSRHLPFRPLLRFCYVYFWQLGFLDGRPGYYFARLHATYELLSIAKTYELRHAQRR